MIMWLLVYFVASSVWALIHHRYLNIFFDVILRIPNSAPKNIKKEMIQDAFEKQGIKTNGVRYLLIYRLLGIFFIPMMFFLTLLAIMKSGVYVTKEIPYDSADKKKKEEDE